MEAAKKMPHKGEKVKKGRSGEGGRGGGQLQKLKQIRNSKCTKDRCFSHIINKKCSLV